MTVDLPEPTKYPSLRSAAILLLLVIPAAGAITGLAEGIDVVFLRFISALFVYAGFTVAALLVNNVRPAAILGKRPALITLAISFLAGVAVWPSATWLLSLFAQTLGGLYGNLPRGVGSTASLETQAVMFGIVLPICQGLLFFGYIFTAAQGIGRWRGVLLTAVLFGLFGIFSAGQGVSAVLSYALIGVVAGVLTLRSGSMWAGVLVISGFNLGEPILRQILIATLLKGQVGDPLSFGWLTTVVIALFVTFALVQVARALVRSDGAMGAGFAPPRRGWWLPILAVIVLSIVIGYGEIITRRQAGISKPRPTPTATTSGSTSPPLTPSQTPKPAN